VSYDFDPRQVEAWRKLTGITVRAVADDEYRHRLLDDPKSVLEEAGLEIPDCMEVAVHQNRPGLLHLVLPQALPESEKLDLDSVDLAAICYWWPI
jgi:hypothetical protein